MLLGRADEVGRIDRLLRAAVEERSSAALIVHGHAGVGKTCLLEHVAATHADSFRVLRAHPLEAESALAFAGLADLLRPIQGQLAALPERQRAALAGALAIGPPVPGDRFAVAAATLSLLAVAADDRPVLAIVDDAHWLDAPSRETLMFAGRRLANEGVGLILAMRDRDWVRESGLDALEVQGLAARDAAELVDRTAIAIDAQVRARLIDESHGNPLAILEAIKQLTPEQLRGAAPIVQPLPVGAALEASFAEHLDALPDGRGLLIAAVSDSGSTDEVNRALAEAGLAPAVLEPAERAGLLTVSADRIQFRHPLIRSAVYHRHDAVDRRAAHRAYAAVLGRDRRAAWHHAAASTGPDEAAAAALEAVAEDALARSGYAAAGRAYETAATLSVDDAGRLRRTHAAGRALWLGGEPERASTLLEGVLELATDPLTRADLQQLRGSALLLAQPIPETYELLVSEAERVGPHDGARAAALYAHASLISFPRGRLDHAEECARRGVAADAGRPASDSATLLGIVLANRGELVEARRWLDPQVERFLATDALSEHTQLVCVAATTLNWIGDSARAEALLLRVVDAARAAGAPSLLPFALTQLAEVESCRGRIAASYAAASEAAQLAQEFGLTGDLSFALVTLARVEAMLGNPTACREHVAAATQQHALIGADAMQCYCDATLGLLELSQGRPERALPNLLECRERERTIGVGLAAITQHAPDLVEALARSGATAQAHAALLELEAEADTTGVPWTRAVAARCRGLLADDDFEPHFAVAIEFTEMGFERARALLCLGTRRLRAQRRSDARAALREALDYFEAVGAEPWAEQARHGLRAAGATNVATSDGSLGTLTPQELRVALTVAKGASNREAAAALFLSEKTVEFHLRNTYRKLGVRSRVQLALHVEGISQR